MVVTQVPKICRSFRYKESQTIGVHTHRCLKYVEASGTKSPKPLVDTQVPKKYGSFRYKESQTRGGYERAEKG